MTALRLTLLFVLAAMAASAQPRVTVTVSPREPRVGDTVTFSLTIEGGRGTSASGDDVEAPDASGGLSQTSRRPTLDATTSLNGRTERRLAWSYVAATAGAARLGPTSVRVGSRVFTTDPVDLTVGVAVAAPRAAPTSPIPREPLAVRIEPDRRRAVVGEQVVVDVVLYADDATQPTQTLALGAWDTPGFWREELDAGVAVPRRVGGGRTAYTVERLALFPTRAGTLTIAPRRLRVTLVEYDQPDPDDPFGGFFSPFRQSRRTVTVESPRVEIAVTPPPAGAPAAFSGAVGRFTMERRADRTAVDADEPVRVTLTFAGDGNLATLPVPTLELPPSVDLFGPDDTRDADRLGARLSATRTLTYTLVPSAGGEIAIPAFAWSFYDPSAATYRTLTAPAATIRVTGDAAAAVAAAPALALRTSARWRRGVPLAWLWALLGAGVASALLLGGVSWWRRRRAERPAPVPAPTPVGPGGTYAETEAVLRETLAARFGVSPALPSGRLAETLVGAGVTRDVAQRLQDTLAACERGQFAPGLAGTPRPETLAAEARDALAALHTPHRQAPVVAGIALLLVVASSSVGAQTSASPAALFETGAALVAEGDTAGAVAAWAAAERLGRETGRASADVSANLGLVALAQGDAARARLHLERAARLAPLDGDIRAALAEARTRAVARPPSRLSQVWAVLTVGGPAPFVVLAVALSLAAALGARRRRVVVGAAIVSLALAVGALAEAQRPRGVAVEAATLRTAPSPDAPESGALAVGASVRPGATVAGWTHVRAPGADGWLSPTSGWAPAGAVAR